jgi:hypothetical protein
MCGTAAKPATVQIMVTTLQSRGGRQPEESDMKKLITVAALAAAVISTPAFARSNATYMNHRPVPIYQQNDSLDWVHDHAKGYLG